MEAARTHPSATGRSRHARLAALVTTVLLLAGCSAGATSAVGPVSGFLPRPVGSFGYVVCPTAISPIELRTRTAEPPIPLPVQGTPPLGSFAVATSPDGRWAYVATSTTPPHGQTSNVVVPVDLVTERAGRPIVIPGHGATRAVVVLHGGRTIVVASGTTLVPVDATTRAVGTPLDLGTGRTVSGMALSPTSAILYVLVPDGVVPVDTATARALPVIVTGLGVSSVSSPHGLAVSGDGATLYVVGQGGPDFGGRVVAVATATGTVGPATGFDQFGIADPAAVALAADGATLLVADSADNWIVLVRTAGLTLPAPPVRLPTGTAAAAATGTDHPSDIVVGPGSTGAFVVTGLDTVLPYAPATGSFGPAIRVCAGASSMVVSGN
jgi:hypothetical protein